MEYPIWEYDLGIDHFQGPKGRFFHEPFSLHPIAPLFVAPVTDPGDRFIDDHFVENNQWIRDPTDGTGNQGHCRTGQAPAGGLV